MTEPRKGLVAGTDVGTLKTGGNQVRRVQVQFSDPQDVRVLDLMQSSGEDTNPPNNAVAIVAEWVGNKQSVVGTRDALTPTANQGEREFYSTDNPATVKKARFKLKLNGKVYLATVTGATDLGTQLANLLTANQNLVTALLAFSTGLNAGTLTAQGAALAAALPAITTSLTNVNTGLASLLDSTP